MNALLNSFEITVDDLYRRFERGELLTILDVRQEWEVKKASLQNTICMPLDQLSLNFSFLPQEYPIIVLCHHGIRSLRAATFLRDQGYQAFSLQGGIDAWAEKIDLTVPRY